jgi:hypothetical protein
MLKRLGDVEDSVWIFRILIQINQLSAGAPLNSKDRAAFEAALQRLFACLRECNDARQELGRLIKQHIEDVREGRSVVVSNGHIEVLEDIEPALNRTTNSFFVAARTVLYHLFGQKADPSKGPHTRSLTEILSGHNLSFAQSKKDVTFEKEATKFLLAKPGQAANHLIDVLRSDRTTWSLGLQDIRDTIIHDTTYQGLKMLYRASGERVAIGLPKLNGTEISQFVEVFWNNLVDAVEEITLACIGTKMPAGLAIVPIPKEEWDTKLPMRWKAVFINDPNSKI